MSLVLAGVRKLYPEFELRLDLAVGPGELLTLLGPSGCGKTTTLRMVAGFLEPDTGRIEIAGRPVDGVPPHLRGTGIVFQDYALFPHLSVSGNVAFGPRMHGWPPARTGERVRELLRLVHLEGYERRKVTRLSGGEQQRVALARALAPEPGLLLLDEPLSALDAKLRRSLRAEIRRIQRETRLTTLYVTHDQEEALALSDRVAVMRRGRIEQIGTPWEVYHRPSSLFVAGFVGEANLLPGRLAGGADAGDVDAGEAAPGWARVRTELGDFRVPGEAAGACPAPGAAGGEVYLFFRPEKCRLAGALPVPSAGGRAAENRFRAEVLSTEYLGDAFRAEMRADGRGGGGRRLVIRSADPPRRGEVLEIAVDARDCWLLPAPAAPPGDVGTALRPKLVTLG